MLDHEKLDVYQRSVEFFALAVRIIEKIPKGNSVLKDQFNRASLSILLNIAEGTGKTSQKDKQRFYAIARGSAMECGAILDACKVLGLIKEPVHDEGKNLLTRIVSMLTKMCRF